MPEAWRFRVIEERLDLGERLQRLIAFLDASAPGASADDLALLRRQRDAMIAYLDVLDERIGRFGMPDETGEPNATDSSLRP